MKVKMEAVLITIKLGLLLLFVCGIDPHMCDSLSFKVTGALCNTMARQASACEGTQGCGVVEQSDVAHSIFNTAPGARQT